MKTVHVFSFKDELTNDIGLAWGAPEDMDKFKKAVTVLSSLEVSGDNLSFGRVTEHQESTAK